MSDERNLAAETHKAHNRLQALVKDLQSCGLNVTSRIEVNDGSHFHMRFDCNGNAWEHLSEELDWLASDCYADSPCWEES